MKIIASNLEEFQKIERNIQILKEKFTEEVIKQFDIVEIKVNDAICLNIKYSTFERFILPKDFKFNQLRFEKEEDNRFTICISGTIEGIWVIFYLGFYQDLSKFQLVG